MKKFIGIDLHSNNSVVVVSDEADRVMFRKRMANDLKLIEAALAPHRDETVGVVIESTYNWYWLVDGLMDAGRFVAKEHTVPSAPICATYPPTTSARPTAQAAHQAYPHPRRSAAVA